LGKSWEFLLNKHTHNTLQSKAGFSSKKSFSFTKLQKMPPCYQTKETRHALFSSVQRKVMTSSSMQRTIKDSLEATLVTNSKIKSLSVKT